MKSLKNVLLLEDRKSKESRKIGGKGWREKPEDRGQEGAVAGAERPCGLQMGLLVCAQFSREQLICSISHPELPLMLQAMGRGRGR